MTGALRSHEAENRDQVADVHAARSRIEAGVERNALIDEQFLERRIGELVYEAAPAKLCDERHGRQR
jgi:hypothetical protein